MMNETDSTNSNTQNSATEVLSVTISLPQARETVQRALVQELVQFLFLDNQTTYYDWVIFTVKATNQNVKCFDSEQKLYLETTLERT